MKLSDDEDDVDNDYDEIMNAKKIPSLYDETVEVVGADDVTSPPSSAGFSVENKLTEDNISSDIFGLEKEGRNRSDKKEKWNSKNTPVPLELMSDNSENSEDDDEDDDNDVQAPVIQGAYNPNDYEGLAVSEDIKDIFGYITRYTPQNIELENKLSPFLPDFIPAVGDIDAFIKVPRPDGKKDGLGLNVLDEPCLQQSDPAVLQLQLRAVEKQSSAKAMVVKKIENAEKNGKSIDRWIKAISDLHSTKPSPTVQHPKPMPNIDNLMQEWPLELEEKFSSTSIPNPDLDCDLQTYAAIICSMFDIPVYDSTIYSLHTFFTLYSTMKSTQEQLTQTQATTDT